jgi:hypothetical protein
LRCCAADRLPRDRRGDLRLVYLQYRRAYHQRSYGSRRRCLLQISDDYDGPYSSAAVLDAFVGTLNPSHTDNILNGFQKVTGFTNGKENQPQLVANLFARSTDSDYYQTSLFFRTNGNPQDFYSRHFL